MRNKSLLIITIFTLISIVSYSESVESILKKQREEYYKIQKSETNSEKEQMKAEKEAQKQQAIADKKRAEEERKAQKEQAKLEKEAQKQQSITEKKKANEEKKAVKELNKDEEKEQVEKAVVVEEENNEPEVKLTGVEKLEAGVAHMKERVDFYQRVQRSVAREEADLAKLKATQNEFIKSNKSKK